MASEKQRKVVRVCFVSPKAYPLFNPDCEGVFGGAEVDLYLVGTALAKDETFRVSCIVADYGQAGREVREDVTLIKSVDFSKGSLSGALKIWRAMKAADADIYVLETVSPGVPLAACFCRLHGRAFVYRTASVLECNGQYVKEHGMMGRAFLWSLRRANVVVTQSKSDRQNMRRTTGIESVVIPNGHRFAELSSVDRQSILWVGRSDSIKGPGRFIDLARQVPAERFVMICQKATGDASYDKLVEEARAVENIEFIERVPFDEVIRYFERAKVLVNTSDSEGFPNTFVEACKCATAILSLNANPDDFLTRYSCGVACSASGQSLVEGLQFLLENERYVELGANGREYAEKHHDISKIVDRYKDVFQELAGGVRRGSSGSDEAFSQAEEPDDS